MSRIMEAEDDVRGRAIVRAYSFEVEQRLPEGHDAYILGQALAHNRETTDRNAMTRWRTFFDPVPNDGASQNPITEILRVESARLREKWINFYKKSPKDEQVDIDEDEPSVLGVVNTVKKITDNWEAKRKEGRTGKAKTYFHKFCGVLKSHSAVIQILPQGNEYVSLFTGTLNTILKASANHERIAEGLGEGLCTISEHIEEISRDVELFNTAKILEMTADFCAHIFLFLTSVMDWISEKRRKRLMDSFNEESFSTKFDKEMKVITRKAELIRNLASQTSRAEIRVTRVAIEGMQTLQRDIRIGLEGEARYQADTRHCIESIQNQLTRAEQEREQERRQNDQRLAQLGATVKHALEQGTIVFLRDNQPRHPSIMVHQLFESTTESTTLPVTVTTQISEQIAINSRYLEDFFSRDRVRLPFVDFSHVAIDAECISRLAEWSQGAAAPIFWLNGLTLEGDDLENPITMLAARFIEMVVGAHLSVISYFCSILTVAQDGSRSSTPEEQGSVALLYALIRQMIELLLPRFDTSVNMSEERLSQLDGTMRSWKEALALFKDLVCLVGESRETVFCVIDGLHWLDDKSTSESLALLVETLRYNSKLRVLFTTSGRSSCLLDDIDRDEMFSVTGMHFQTNDHSLMLPKEASENQPCVL